MMYLLLWGLYSHRVLSDDKPKSTKRLSREFIEAMEESSRTNKPGSNCRVLPPPRSIYPCLKRTIRSSMTQCVNCTRN